MTSHQDPRYSPREMNMVPAELDEGRRWKFKLLMVAVTKHVYFW